MINYLIEGAKMDAKEATRKVTWLLGGSLCVLLGLGFLAAAGWVVLAELRGAAFASLVCGAAFTGLGLIVIGIAHMRHRRYLQAKKAAAARGAPAAAAVWVPLAEAFLLGLSAARGSGGRSG